MTSGDAPWWQRATAYQIYPRSFCDGNGDGVGDIPGIVSKLDHLEALGIDVVWLSPVCASPMVDMGYDISDYRDIAPEFGTLDDFDRMIAEGAKRGIRFIMDLVVNHSSNQHEWFRQAAMARDNPYRDYYIWRDPDPVTGGPPNGMQSFFGVPAWTFHQPTGQYYFHLFDPAQPDLNWANPSVRAEVHEICRYWLDRGAAGFRMDAIDLIGKEPDRGIGPGGPMMHAYLKEVHEKALEGRDTLTVGEVPVVTSKTALDFCGRAAREMSMVHQFHHTRLSWDPEFGKWKPRPVGLVALKRVLFEWQAALADDGWNALFWSNHDLPRAVSAFGDDGAHRVASAKMLGTALYLMKGMPYVYQGEELGMTNMHWTDLTQFRDVEVFNNFRNMTEAGMSPEAFLAACDAQSRDNARTPMQWTDGPNAGFSGHEPWIPLNPNYAEINAAAQAGDPGSVLAHYRRLLHLRRDRPIVTEGDFTPLAPDHEEVLAYTREAGGQRLTVVASFSPQALDFALPRRGQVAGDCLITNAAARTRAAGRLTLGPYEAFAILGAAD